MYTAYQLIDKGYTDVKNIVEGNFNLHHTFLDALLAVSPAVQDYSRGGGNYFGGDAGIGRI